MWIWRVYYIGQQSGEDIWFLLFNPMWNTLRQKWGGKVWSLFERVGINNYCNYCKVLTNFSIPLKMVCLYGAGHLNANMHGMGLDTKPGDWGEQQTADHIFRECSINHPMETYWLMLIYPHGIGCWKKTSSRSPIPRLHHTKKKAGHSKLLSKLHHTHYWAVTSRSPNWPETPCWPLPRLTLF